MDIKNQAGIYQIRFSNGKLICLAILSKTSFRLFEIDSPKAVSHLETTPLIEGVRMDEKEGSIEIGYLKICFNEDNFKVYKEGGLVLEASLSLDKIGNLSGELRIKNDSPVYGLGDKFAPLDRRGYSFVSWNSDEPHHHNEMMPSLYKSINFLSLFRKENSIGILYENSSKLHFDINKTNKDEVKMGHELGKLDVYFFFGHLHEVVSEYSLLVGPNPLPPRWALGHQQSRWSYFSIKEVNEVIEGYKKEGIPLSAINLDIDYMHEYEDFTINEETFPNIKQWIASLKKDDIHIVAIIDAGIAAKENYEVYLEGLEKGYFSTLNGEIYHNEVWPGDSVFPAFLKEEVREWWSQKVASFLDYGFDGIWNDMNEPAHFLPDFPLDVDMGGLTHDLAHNIYAHYENEATYEGFLSKGKRPYIITRAAYAGTSKFAIMWGGDNQSTWSHLYGMLSQVASMALSGVSNFGVDIGGFGGDSTPELVARWAMAALINPLYRNHSALGTLHQEGFRLPLKERNAYKKAVDTRYELLPTLYDLLHLHEVNGVAIVRPLIYNYEDDSNLVNENSEIMLGDSLLLAPIYEAGKSKRLVYFPETFYHYPSGKRFDQGYSILDLPLEEIPLFIKQNSLVILNPKDVKDSHIPDSLRLLYNGDKVSAYHYEDEGDGLGYKKGKYNLYKFEIINDELKIETIHSGISSKYKHFILEKIG